MNRLSYKPRHVIRLSDLDGRLATQATVPDADGTAAVRVDTAPPALKRPAVARAHDGVDIDRIERAVREILLAIGEDPERDGLRETPRRVAKAYRELFAGLRQDPAIHLSRVFEQETEDLVAVRDIQFFTVCEHHLLPFFGHAHVAYRPSANRVVGLSKLARTVEVFARRPQVQERLTGQIAEAVARHLGAAGVAVVCEAQHMCMAMRGIGRAGSTTTTAAFRGVFKQDPVEREHALRLLGVGPVGGGGCR